MTNYFALSAGDSIKITDGVDYLKVSPGGSIEGANLDFASNSTVASNNSQTVYTCPADTQTKIKKLAINSSAASGGSGFLYVFVNGVAVHRQKLDGGTANPGANNQFIDLGDEYLLLAVGQTIVIQSTSSYILGYCTAFYNEESV